jgi:NAD(P)-dependent dehydrogenase (short-subunit alcohol dehydrogenase family)
MKDKVVLITGGASGIGKAIAERFLFAGARVTIFDQQAVSAGQFDPDDRVVAIRGDVAREPDVRDVVSRTNDRFGLIDVLFNVAGIELSGRIEEYSADDWDRQMAVNLKGAFLFAKHTVPQMKGRGGVIVNISSIDALMGYPMLAAYDSSKAGLLAFTRSLALECGPDGIRVNAICPGYTQTPLLQAWFDRQPDPEQVKRDIIASHPLRRMGRPSDIAEAAFFLASDAASFITGTYLVVDGGITAAGP